MRKLGVLAVIAVAPLPVIGVAGCGGSTSHTTTVIEKPAAVTKPIHHKPKHVATVTPSVTTTSSVGSPKIKGSPPKVDSSEVASYLAGVAGVDVSTTTCNFDTNWFYAQHTASANGIELPSDTLWETYTCTSVDANYFVVFEDLSSGWTATNEVQTS